MHLSLSEHPGCFHVLDTMNIDANESGNANIFSISWFQFFWLNIQKWVDGSYNNSVVSFWGTSTLFPQQLHSFAFPGIEYKGSSFYTSSPTLVVFWFFLNNSHPERYGISSWFGFAFSWWLVKQRSSFIYIMIICMSSWRKCLFKSLAHF